MNKIAIIFGGCGYIGTNLLSFLIKEQVFHKYYIFDIQPLKGFENEIENGLVSYQELDVRNFIPPTLDDFAVEGSWIFNFAAIHREPGHQFKEYFKTNIPGAENINKAAVYWGIRNIFFTSSIAPYGKSMEQQSESSALFPETAYGISKALAEKIHETWLAEDAERRLIIVRPSVIFGPKDPGNVYRMLMALKKGTFVLPNGGNFIKGYGYIYGLVESMLFTINQNKRLIVYNYAENPLVPLKEMVEIAKAELEFKKPTVNLNVRFLVFLSFFIQKGFWLIGKKSDIHPVRVKKAAFPTNIKPQYLIENQFKFKYDFKNALRHWKNVSPEDFE